MTEHDDAYCTFSDEGFERRYSSEDGSGGGACTSPDPARPTPAAARAQLGRSRNRFMRTLLRRRLAASGRT